MAPRRINTPSILNIYEALFVLETSRTDCPLIQRRIVEKQSP